MMGHWGMLAVLISHGVSFVIRVVCKVRNDFNAFKFNKSGVQQRCLSHRHVRHNVSAGVSAQETSWLQYQNAAIHILPLVSKGFPSQIGRLSFIPSLLVKLFSAIAALQFVFINIHCVSSSREYPVKSTCYDCGPSLSCNKR